MKNWKKYLAILIATCYTIAVIPKAHADALTAGMVGSAIMAIGQSLGITWTITNNTAAFTTEWIGSEIDSYENKQSLMNSFAGDAMKATAAKLAIGQVAYNNALEFLSHLAEKYNLQGTLVGTYDHVFDPLNVAGSLNGWAPYPGGQLTPDGSYYYEGWSQNGEVPRYATTTGFYEYQGMGVNYLSTKGTVSYYYTYYSQSRTAGPFEMAYSGMGIPAEDTQVQNIDFSNYGEPQPLPQDKGWEGDFSGTPGFADPPTDLPDFLSRIPVGIAEQNLDVTGQIVDAATGPDQPPPTPSPSPEPTPPPSGPSLSIADKIAIILGEIIGILYDTTGDTAQETIDQVADSVQDVTQTITDAITETQISTSGETQTAIQSQTQTITDTITQTQTQTQTEIKDAIQTQTETLTDTQTEIKDAIQDQTQTITDTQTEIKDAIQDQTQTLTDTQTEIKDAIQDQTQTLEDIKDSIQDATDVPDQWEPQKHPLPRGVFPFCIPFDLHDLILALAAEPQTPEIHVPFNVPAIGLEYTFDLDLHEFDGLAATLRTLEFIAFGVGLLFVTGKVIKW